MVRDNFEFLLNCLYVNSDKCLPDFLPSLDLPFAVFCPQSAYVSNILIYLCQWNVQVLKNDKKQGRCCITIIAQMQFGDTHIHYSTIHIGHI